MGEHLARQANAYSKVANTFANKSLSLDEWNALLAFKQYCEARLADGKSLAEDCLAAVNTTMPAPPHFSSVFGSAARHLNKRSAQALGGMQRIISAMGVVLLMLLEALTANFVSLALGVLVFCGGLAFLGGVQGAEHLHWKAIVDSVVGPFSSGTDSDQRKAEHGEDLLTSGWTTGRASYYPEDPRLADAITIANPKLLEGICRRPGVNLDERYGKSRTTPLIEAVLSSCAHRGYRQLERDVCVDILLSHGANPDLVDASQMTALMYACRNGSLEVVKTLIASHADVKKAMAPQKITALHLACEGIIDTSRTDKTSSLEILKDYCSIVRWLVSAGADINAQDWHGKTPLHRTMCSEHEQHCKVLLTYTLLELGADPFVADHRGLIPRNIFGHDRPDSTVLSETLRQCLMQRVPAIGPTGPKMGLWQQRMPEKGDLNIETNSRRRRNYDTSLYEF